MQHLGWTIGFRLSRRRSLQRKNIFLVSLMGLLTLGNQQMNKRTRLLPKISSLYFRRGKPSILQSSTSQIGETHTSTIIRCYHHTCLLYAGYCFNFGATDFMKNELWRSTNCLFRLLYRFALLIQFTFQAMYCIAYYTHTPVSVLFITWC